MTGDVPFNNRTPWSEDVIPRGSAIFLVLCESEGFQSDKKRGRKKKSLGCIKIIE